LVRGVLQILADDPLRARMAIEGPKRAARYDWRIVTAEYLKLLRALIPDRQATR
jgi:glycosyltransferase involved in cell wall biosynthesis